MWEICSSSWLYYKNLSRCTATWKPNSCTTSFVWISCLYLIFTQLVSLSFFVPTIQTTIWFVYKITWRKTSCLLQDLVFSVSSACRVASKHWRSRRCQHPCNMLCETRLWSLVGMYFGQYSFNNPIHMQAVLQGICHTLLRLSSIDITNRTLPETLTRENVII